MRGHSFSWVCTPHAVGRRRRRVPFPSPTDGKGYLSRQSPTLKGLCHQSVFDVLGVILCWLKPCSTPCCKITTWPLTILKNNLAFFFLFFYHIYIVIGSYCSVSQCYWIVDLFISQAFWPWTHTTSQGFLRTTSIVFIGLDSSDACK